MTEKTEHKIIKSDQCPRCGGTNTETCGMEDTLVETRICLDCEAKDPDGDPVNHAYDACCCEIVAAVRWTTDDGTERGLEHVIYDSHYLADVQALNLLGIAERLLNCIDGSCDRRDMTPEDRALCEEADQIIAKAKGEQL